MARRQRRRVSYSQIIAALVGLMLCLLLVLAVALFEMTPRFAEDVYGGSVAGLSPVQRFQISARLLMAQRQMFTPVNPNSPPQDFEISLGESPTVVAERLEAAGLVPDAETFRMYLIYTGMDYSLQAGQYRLNPALSPVEIAQELQDATPTEVEFNVLAGWREEEIAAAMPTSGLNITPEDFMHRVRNYPQEELPAGWPQTTSVEGFLAPGQYVFPRTATVNEIVAAMVQRFDEQLTAELRQAFEQQGLTLYEAVILASMVEKEGMVADEHPLIASVFYNRIAAGMRFESDPTVQYALGYDAESRSWWKNPLLGTDLGIDSPYNTYLIAGFPPAPICSPGISALRAVAYPAETPYYYFRALCDQSGDTLSRQPTTNISRMHAHNRTRQHQTV